jgi:hypothetical protein
MDKAKKDKKQNLHNVFIVQTKVTKNKIFMMFYVCPSNQKDSAGFLD